VKRLDAQAMRTALEPRAEDERGRGSFVRDRAYFGWRTLHPEADARYRFVQLEQRSSGAMIALALSEHRFKGQRFTILVDAWPDVIDDQLDLLVRAAGGVGTGRLVYLNANRPLRGVRLKVCVPASLDPRPVELLHLPSGAVRADELARAPAMTADWMGF
jgi:hypothetical protein